MSLVFYDTETTGLDTFFDQVLHFAAIQTDTDLKEIDRFNMRSRLLPHIVPAPSAMRINRVSVSQLTDPSIPSHYQMVRAMRAKLLEWSPSLFLGWNSLGFDENLVRQALYQTLHNPYLINNNGNSRSDVMRMARACSIFAPAALTIPIEDGREIFRLHEVTRANGFKQGREHDAVGDVEATIFLCRLIMEEAPEVWSSFMRFSKKAAVVDYIREETAFCLSGFSHGEPFSCIATTIGQNQKNKAEWYVYDLSVDPKSLLRLSRADLAARLAEIPEPVRRLKSNAAPVLFPAEDAPEICASRKLGPKELERRAKTLEADANLRERLISVFESLREEYPASPHVEKQIYDGFIQDADEDLMDAFHAADWSMRKAIVGKFGDPRLKTIGIQLIHLEQPDLLDKASCQVHHLAATKRLLGQGEDISWLTLPEALEQLEVMSAAAPGAELKFLREHERYLRERHKEALAHVKSSK
jgi:exodeoxyribonuclease I